MVEKIECAGGREIRSIGSKWNSAERKRDATVNEKGFQIMSVALCMLPGLGCRAGSEGFKSVSVVAEERAIQYLAREVPAWPRENGCFSCHNNGDGARALMLATRSSDGGDLRGALADTLKWLRAPEKWDENKGDPSASDQQLADLQFAFAVLSASEAELLVEFETLEKAARRVARHQAKDGSWQVEPQNPVGSPVTYGTAMATYVGWKILATVPGDPASEGARSKAEIWLKAAEGKNIPASSALLMFAAESGDAAGKRELVSYLLKHQLANGGWGPYPQAPAEIYDTALAVIALKMAGGNEAAVRRGQSYLRVEQRLDGSWAATTRPSGGESYAQQMSTTGWATLALLGVR